MGQITATRNLVATKVVRLAGQWPFWPWRVLLSEHCQIPTLICFLSPWWRHQMETFSALLALCAVNSPVTGEFPSQRPMTRSFDVFFDLRLNKRLSKHSRRRWFETPSRSLWHHSNVVLKLSLPNPLKPGREWRCSWSSADRRCSNYIWVIKNFIAY